MRRTLAHIRNSRDGLGLRVLGVALALVLVASGCRESVESGGETQAQQGGQSGDVCAGSPQSHGYLVEIGLLDEKDLAELPTPVEFHPDGYWEVAPLGADGASQVGAELSGRWLCDLTVSAEVAATLADMAAHPGEFSEADIVAVITGGDQPGGADGGLPVLSALDVLQQVRDLLDVARIAIQLGNYDTSEEIMIQARDLFGAYAELVMGNAVNPADVLAVVAGADLLGLEDLRNEAMGQVEDTVWKELADAGELFNPCTTDEHVIAAYKRALSRAILLFGPEGSDGTWEVWQDVQSRRKLGEDVPECEGGIIVESVPLEGWNGTLDLHLETCGFVRWTGTVTAQGTLDVEGGSMTLNGEIPIDVSVMTRGSKTSGSADFAGLGETHLVTADATGEGTMVLYGSVFFEVLPTGETGDVEVDLFFSKGEFKQTLHAGGRTIERTSPTDWGQYEFRGDIESLDGLCDVTG